jgi:hypothetical protein
MESVDKKTFENTTKKEEPINVDKLVKFGVLEKEVEPVPGWKVTMHTLGQEERELMGDFVPDEALTTQIRRTEALKRPTLIYAITKINNEIFETPEQKKALFEKLRTTQGTTVDLLYVEYQKLFVEQFGLITKGLDKKKS